MRIALCLSGYFGSTADPNSDGAKGFKYIKETLLDLYNIDVFIHTWDEKREKEIKSLYKKWVKDIVVQSQYSFEEEVKLIPDEEFKKGGVPPSTPFLTLSQAYGRKQSLLLKKKYEKENSFEYDCVIYSRFDLGIRDLHAKEIYRCCEIVFSKKLDMTYFYTKFWDQLNQGFADMWLYSSSKNMDTYSTYYDKLFEYLQLESKYVNVSTRLGWPDSVDHVMGVDEFSDEMLKIKKSHSPLKTYPPNWAFGNNHMLHKWFLMDVGLYRKCRFPIDIKRFKSINNDWVTENGFDKNLIKLI